MPVKRKDLPEGKLWSYPRSTEVHRDAGLVELKTDPSKVTCLPCKAHVFAAKPFLRKGVKKHIESQKHQRAVRTAARVKEEESAHRARVRRIDAATLKAEAKRFASSSSGELPAKTRPFESPLTIEDLLD